MQGNGRVAGKLALSKLLDDEGELTAIEQVAVLVELEAINHEPPLLGGAWGMFGGRIVCTAEGWMASYRCNSDVSHRTYITHRDGRLYTTSDEALEALARHLLEQRDAAHRIEGESVARGDREADVVTFGNYRR